MTDTPHRSFAVAVLVAALAVTTAVPVVAATTGAAGSTVDVQEQPQVRLGSATADSGSTTTVELATDAGDVAGYQANVTFDPGVLEVESVAGTESFGEPVVNVNNDEGWVFVTQSQVEGTDEPELARITFAAVGDDGDRSALGLVDADTVLNDADSTSVDAALSPGEVAVVGGDSASSDASSDADGDGDSVDSQNADARQPSGASSGGPLGGIDPVTAVGGAAVLGGTAAAGAYLGQRLG